MRSTEGLVAGKWELSRASMKTEISCDLRAPEAPQVHFTVGEPARQRGWDRILDNQHGAKGTRAP